MGVELHPMSMFWMLGRLQYKNDIGATLFAAGLSMTSHQNTRSRKSGEKWQLAEH